MTSQKRVRGILERDEGYCHLLPPQEHDPFLGSTVDRDGKLVHISEGLCALLSFEKKDVLGQDQSCLLASEFAQPFLTSACDLLDTGESWRGDVCHRAKDGELIWFDCLVTPLRGRNGSLDQVVTLRADASGRSRTHRPGLSSTHFLEQTGRAAKVGGWDLDLETGAISWTDETFRIHGRERGYHPTLADSLLHYPDHTRNEVTAAIEKAATSGEGWCLDLPFFKFGGPSIWVRVVGKAEFFCGKPRRLFGTIQDVTEIVSRKLEVEALNERMALATESGSIGIWEYDLATDVLRWDRLMARLFGLPEKETVGNYQTWLQYVHPEDMASAQEAVTNAISGIQALDTEFRITRADGEIRHIRATARVNQDPLTGAVRLIGVNWDNTEHRRLAAEMHFRTTHDALTGLMNRNAFEERVYDAIRTSEMEQPCAVLAIDLDQFKIVNDVCGHKAGDRLLQRITALLQEQVQGGDFLARLGSDEFAVLARRSTLTRAEALAASICNRFDEYRFEENGRRFRISASVGVVSVDGRWPDVASVMQAACSACGAAKAEGRDRFYTWRDADAMVRSRHGETHWATRIEHALDDDRFVLYAQIIEPITASVGPLRAEVLLRMVDLDGSLISPGTFVPAAERFHLASRIDRWVLRKSLQWLSQLEDVGSVGTLCINLSGQSIGDQAFRKQVVNKLTAAGRCIAQKICLEITETSAITDLDSGVAFMSEVRALGVRVALDDFGSGNSSFGYLKRLPIDFLKIDGQFIRGLTSGSLDEAAVRCFTEVARVIGVQTVAEFIETPEVLTQLARLGVDYGQGYLLHKPVPISQILLPQTETCVSPSFLKSDLNALAQSNLRLDDYSLSLPRDQCSASTA